MSLPLPEVMSDFFPPNDCRLILSELVDAAYTDGAHHKQWYIVSAIKQLVGHEEYQKWCKTIEDAGEYWPPEDGMPP